jgi:hypothetical protein
MASRGQPLWVPYRAWDKANNDHAKADAAHHTLRWWKDGAAASLDYAGSVVEVDPLVLPGVYAVQLSADETDCNVGLLGGVSSTAGVVILPTPISFEQLPIQAPGQSNGLPLLNNAALLKVILDYTAALPNSYSPGTVGESLWASLAQGFGRWVLNGNQLQLFDSQGGTLLRTFTLTFDPDHPTKVIERV